MRVAIRRVPGLLVALLIAAPALAQFGQPLKGTWSGDWGPTKENRARVLLELHWDGKAITGKINPGPKAVEIQKATLDPTTWGVHQRFITGTWTEGDRKGDFKVVRN